MEPQEHSSYGGYVETPGEPGGAGGKNKEGQAAGGKNKVIR